MSESMKSEFVPTREVATKKFDVHQHRVPGAKHITTELLARLVNMIKEGPLPSRLAEGALLRELILRQIRIVAQQPKATILQPTTRSLMRRKNPASLHPAVERALRSVSICRRSLQLGLADLVVHLASLAILHLDSHFCHLPSGTCSINEHLLLTPLRELATEPPSGGGHQAFLTALEELQADPTPASFSLRNWTMTTDTFKCCWTLTPS